MINSRHVPQLDGIRGLAIAMVLFWHYGCNFSESPALKAVGALTWSGVDLFFVLSGFLIGGILLDNRSASGFWAPFYTRRACRILPLYFVALAAFLALSAIGGFPWLTDNPLPLLSYDTFTQNIAAGWLNHFGAQFMGVTWSLAVEEQFYLLLPLIVRFCPLKVLPKVLLALIAAAPISRIAVFHWFSADHLHAAYTLTICRSDALLIGVFCAWAVRNNAAHRLLLASRSGLKLALCVLAIGMLWFEIFSPTYYAKPMIFVGLTWTALFYASILLVAVIEPDGAIARVAKLSPLMGLGSIAYGVYLFHIPVAGVLHQMIFGAPPSNNSIEGAAVTLLSLAATILLAVVSLRWFEKPITDLGRQIGYTAIPAKQIRAT